MTGTLSVLCRSLEPGAAAGIGSASCRPISLTEDVARVVLAVADVDEPFVGIERRPATGGFALAQLLELADAERHALAAGRVLPGVGVEHRLAVAAGINRFAGFLDMPGAPDHARLLVLLGGDADEESALAEAVPQLAGLLRIGLWAVAVEQRRADQALVEIALALVAPLAEGDRLADLL